MGFRCPLCKKDFGNSKESLEAHAKYCVSGMAEIFITKVRSICEEKKDDEVEYEECANRRKNEVKEDVG